MAEEVIRMQEGTETPSEPMGTVISMESVKPAAENVAQQREQEEGNTQEQVPEAVQAGPVSEEASKPAKETAPGPVFYEPPQREREEEPESGGHAGESARGWKKKRGSDFFHLRKDLEDFTREDWILSRIPQEDLMEYLRMEQKNSEMLRNAKEIKEKRIFTTLQIALSMSAIVAVVALLKDNPTVLVNILYITGIVIALWIWRGKQDK